MNYLNNFSNKRANVLLFALVIIDMLFCLVTFGMALANERVDFLNVSIDRGLPEIFQYAKYIMVLFILSYLMFQKNRKNYICWFVLFFVMLLDDALSFHETSGKFLALSLNIQPFMGLRSVDYGELLYAFIAGITILPLMAYCYIFGDKTFKKSFLDLSLLLIVLLFFGIFVDMLHSYFSDIYPLGGIFGLLEDGGEMIALSLIAWYLLFIAISTNNRQVYLHSPLLGMQK